MRFCQDTRNRDIRHLCQLNDVSKAEACVELLCQIFTKLESMFSMYRWDHVAAINQVQLSSYYFKEAQPALVF